MICAGLLVELVDTQVLSTNTTCIHRFLEHRGYLGIQYNRDISISALADISADTRMSPDFRRCTRLSKVVLESKPTIWDDAINASELARRWPSRF